MSPGDGQGPVYLAMAAVWAYWLGVLFMAIRARLKGAASAGLVPKQAIEKIMWIVWVPVITGWILFPWLSVSRDGAAWQIPKFFLEDPLLLNLRWLAALMTVICLGATIYCWRWMGRNWRVGVTPDEQTELITGGPFRHVRHPIYSVSMLMMVCTLFAVPIWPLLVASMLHIILMNLKARNEETWMAQAHGQAYTDYRKQAGRFFPKLGPASSV